MSKILIKNFGPIQRFEQNVDENLMILIGEQASGKSTIAKCVFFCKSISDEFKRFIINQDNLKKSGHQTPFNGYIKRLRTKFLEYFGTTKHMNPFSIDYTFDNNEKVTIQLKDGYALFRFSNKLKEDCECIIDKMIDFYNNQSYNPFSFDTDLSIWISHRENFIKMVEQQIDVVFAQPYTTIFVPAGRSMLATNPDFFQHSTPNEYDVILKDFIQRIVSLRSLYSQKIEDIVEDRKKLHSEAINFTSVNKAMELIKKILKGYYINDKLGERIYYDNDNYVKLIQASSGQQESLWIILLIFSIVLNNQKVYMVIEEPEAHLFPTAQKLILELVMLMINSTGSKVVITTHSPYILSSTNLLIYSSFVEGANTDSDSIVDSDYRLNSNYVTAYLLKDHISHDIFDRDTHMIELSNIDDISEVINETLDSLIEKEIRNNE